MIHCSDLLIIAVCQSIILYRVIHQLTYKYGCVKWIKSVSSRLRSVTHLVLSWAIPIKEHTKYYPLTLNGLVKKDHQTVVRFLIWITVVCYLIRITQIWRFHSTAVLSQNTISDLWIYLWRFFQRIELLLCSTEIFKFSNRIQKKFKALESSLKHIHNAIRYFGLTRQSTSALPNFYECIGS